MNATNSSPTTVFSLSELGASVDSTLRPYNTLVGLNLGNNTLIAAVPMHQFFSMSAVANEIGLAEAHLDGQPVAQRKLDPKHAQKLAVYMLRGLIETLFAAIKNNGKPVPSELERIRVELGKQPYFALQPIVVNIRTSGPGGDGLKYEQLTPGYVKVYLSDRDTMWVVDGQHRRFGMDMVFDYLDFILKNHAYPKRSPLYRPAQEVDMSGAEVGVWQQVFELARSKCTVLLDIHLGLTSEQERQLFHDLNNLGKRVEAGLAFQFDESNPINLFIKDELIDKGILNCTVVDKDVTNWHDDSGVIARKDLIAVNARLLLNKTTVSGAKPQEITGRIAIAKEFWEAVSAIPYFGDVGAKKKTVAAQPVVLKALAKLTYDFAFGRESDPKLLEQLLQGIDEIDFRHTNPMWRYFELAEPDLVQYGLKSLSEYFPPDDKGANRDVGGWDSQEGVMRFGAKHNDIVPILGDMIRWKLQLPNRQKARMEAVAA